jgi:hypothetical protein
MGVRIPQDVVIIALHHEVIFDAVSPSLAFYRCEPAHFARQLFRAAMQVARGQPLHNPYVRIEPHFERGEMLPPGAGRAKRS